MNMKKWSTYHQINDDKPYQHGSSNPIRNWNRQYQGWMSIRYALEQSLNVPAVKTFEEVGSDRAKEFAEGLGVTFGTDHLDPRDAIGGTSSGMTPLEMAGAYTAFGNEGIYTEPYAVTKVEFPDGSVVDLKPESEAVMSDYTAYMVTDMLKSVIQDGTGKNANIPGLPVVGKTGTTDGPNNSWFSGYTTNYTIAVWTGYNDNSRNITETQIPHYLFKNTMEELSKDIDTEDFKKPDSVVEVAVEKGSNPPALPSDYTPKDKIVTELFVKGTEPSQVSEEFDTLDPVSDLNAVYDENDDAINITWGYDDDADVSFEVSYKVDDGDMRELTTTSDQKASISNIEKDATYTIQVVAVSNDSDAKSEAKTTKVELKQEEEEDEEVGSISNLDASYNNGGIDVTYSMMDHLQHSEVDINGKNNPFNPKMSVLMEPLLIRHIILQ